MNALRSALICACALSLAACSRDTDGTPFEPDPLAALRFINAVPDTMAMDYRIVSSVTNAGMFDAEFRTNQRFYTPILAGQHMVTVFLSSTDPAIASTVVAEETLNLTAGTNYTFIHSGFMRTGGTPAAAISVVEDSPPTPGGGMVALRVLNLAVGQPAMDVFVGTDDASELPGTTATWTDVAAGSTTDYVQMGVDALRLATTETGLTTPALVANTAAPEGDEATGTSSPIPGVMIEGSVLTMVILPPSVAGSLAPQGGAFDVPGVVFLVDRRPDN
jgi:hypothetical protein